MTAQARMSGKIIAITGAARGIGLATATTLKGLGARLAIGDIDAAAAAEAVATHELDMHSALDVSSRQSFTDFFDAVERTLGPIDVLVNNAGVIAVGNAVNEADAATRRLLDVNVYGVILGTKLALERMLPRGTGHIINIASVGGVTPTSGIATYCATKHAVLGFTESARLENRGTGVRFSAVMPTLTNTTMIAGTQTTRGLKNAEPADVARAIAALVARPRSRVVVPKSLGAVLTLQGLLPQSVGEALGRWLGADKVFTDVDTAARELYAKRSGTS